MTHRNECRIIGIPLSWMMLMILDACLMVMVTGQDSDPDRGDAAIGNVQPPEVTQVEGAGDIGAEEIRFAAVDIVVDSGGTPLAAYQFEMRSRRPGVEIVGIEGGEHTAYAEPPFYDPRAMHHNRVILAGFSTAAELPVGMSRVARVHLQLQGPGELEFETRLVVAATRDGETIPATMTLKKAVL